MSVRLDPRTRQMRDLYVKQRLTMKEIGERFEMTGERVRQILAPLNLEMHYGSRKHEEFEARVRAAFARVTAGKSTVDQEAASMGYKTGHGLRVAFSRFGLKLGKQPEAAHGTRHRYNRYACRCNLCRKAMREAYLERCARGPSVHGTPSAYTNFGCHCDACRIAQRHYMRKLKARKRQRKEPVDS